MNYSLPIQQPKANRMNYSRPIQQLKTNSLHYILSTEKEACTGLKERKGTGQKGTLNAHNSDDIF